MDTQSSSELRARFDAAAKHFSSQTALQREMVGRLLDRLDGLRLEPATIVDLGCGPAPAARELARRFRSARVLAVDVSMPMLRKARRQAGWRQRRFRCLNADARGLPLAGDSVDLIFANLLLPWVDDLPALLNGLRRILRPEGLLLLSALGPDSASASPLDVMLEPSLKVCDVQRLGDALMRAGFVEPVLDTDWFTTRHENASALREQLLATGLGAPGGAQPPSAVAVQAQWEAVFASAWGPQHGAPVRSAQGEEASVPLAGIGRRQR